MSVVVSGIVPPGWDAVAWNFGDVGEPTDSNDPTTAWSVWDLAAVVERKWNGRYRMIAVVGFSLGGNLTLKFLGKAIPPHRR